MKTLYVVPWYDCNLKCPHCNVRVRKVKSDFRKLIKTLRTTQAENIVLFGGEPTLYWEKTQQIIATRKITSISTNLMSSEWFTENYLAIALKQFNISVATSWNYERFTDEQLQTWLTNLRVLTRKGIDVLVLITLTERLLEGSLTRVNDVLGMIEGVGVQKFLYEPYIGKNECNEKADEWLCIFHDNYTGGMTNLIEEKLDNWNCDCNETYTLEPDGEIRKGCPDSLVLKEKTYCNDCLTCNKVDRCRPCMLQKTCSYPKKLSEKLGK